MAQTKPSIDRERCLSYFRLTFCNWTALNSLKKRPLDLIAMFSVLQAAGFVK